LSRRGALRRIGVMTSIVPIPSCRAAALRRPASHGFTLLEVLVAIVVLSFGVLGVVGLQAVALQSNRDARNQSIAVAMARELGDLMRGNKDVAIRTTNNPYVVNFTGTVPTAGASCYTGACATPQAVGEFGISEWLSRVDAALPQARVVVCFDDDPYDSTTKLPQWDCAATVGGVLVVKIGWARNSVKRGENVVSVRGTGASGLPAVVLPLIAGSPE
jgi:type IV pilus assembly protein PilV